MNNLSAPDFRLISPSWPTLKVYTREQGKISYPVMNLVQLQAETNYSWLCWADGKRMLMPRTLKYYTALIPADLFFRLHRNCIVNRLYIEGLERLDTGSGVVHLTTGEILPVSRRRWAAVKKQLKTDLS